MAIAVTKLAFECGSRVASSPRARTGSSMGATLPSSLLLP